MDSGIRVGDIVEMKVLGCLANECISGMVNECEKNWFAIVTGKQIPDD